MIANAMAIAAREAEAGDAPAQQAAVARLYALLRQRAVTRSHVADATAVRADLNRRLAAEIRSGRLRRRAIGSARCSTISRRALPTSSRFPIRSALES